MSASALVSPPEAAWTATELKAELLGTFTLILGGCSVVATAQARALDGIHSPNTNADAMYINFGWAVSVAMGVLVSFDASGAHLNPAVTLANVIHSGFDKTKAGLFMAMQFLGAFLAAILVGIMFTGPGRGAYVNNFYHTGPSPQTSMANAFLVEIVATAMLLITIGFLVNGGPPAPNKAVVAFGVGAIIFFIGMTMGYLTGYSLNPARELSPRLVRTIDDLLRNSGKGFGTIWGKGDWLAPSVGPLIGAPLGTLIWKLTSKQIVDPPSQGMTEMA